MRWDRLAGSYARLKEAHKEQGQQMQRLQEEAKKVLKYRQTAKQQVSAVAESRRNAVASRLFARRRKPSLR